MSEKLNFEILLKPCDVPAVEKALGIKLNPVVWPKPLPIPPRIEWTLDQMKYLSELKKLNAGRLSAVFEIAINDQIPWVKTPEDCVHLLILIERCDDYITSYQQALPSVTTLDCVATDGCKLSEMVIKQ